MVFTKFCKETLKSIGFLGFCTQYYKKPLVFKLFRNGNQENQWFLSTFYQKNKKTNGFINFFVVNVQPELLQVTAEK